MQEAKTHTVRPWPDRTNCQNFFRIYIEPRNLLSREFHAGDICNICTSDDSVYCAIVWPGSKEIKGSVVQTSDTLRSLYGLELGAKISIAHTKKKIEDATTLDVCEVVRSKTERALTSLDKTMSHFWESLLKVHLENAEILSPGMEVDLSAGVIVQERKVIDETRRFKIRQIDSSRELRLFRTQPHIQVHIRDDWNSLVVARNGIGGLDKQFEELNQEIESFARSTSMIKGRPPPKHGIVLYGPPGTGKTMLLRRICEASWRSIFHITSRTIGAARNGDYAAVFKNVISDAQASQPSVIIIDCLESIVGKRGGDETSTASNVGQSLSEELERLRGTQTLAIGATRELGHIDEGIRRCFPTEIEMPIPDSKAREAILKVCIGLNQDSEDATVEKIAIRTHGFVGADLETLCEKAQVNATRRIHASARSESDARNKLQHATSRPIESDYHDALLKVRPTVKRFVVTADVRWSDIGGQQSIKKEIEKAMVWPLKYPETMKKHKTATKRGMLLYGPPGCSKTMTAKAIATESGHNLIAVKGAELLSMYVGESERAMRELFRNARFWSPSIIFFDEIDALASARSAGQHEGVHILATLLNELDGIEELKGVFVLAATNRPEVLDPALTRPGRFDKMLYVGPPKMEARQEILQNWLRGTKPADDLDIVRVAEATKGFSGADVINLCAHAGDLVAEEEIDSGIEKHIGQGHFEQALLEMSRSISDETIRWYEEFAARRHSAKTF